MVSVDMRTRLDADVVLIDPVTFVADELPDLLRRNGRLAARGAALVGAKALGVDVEGTCFTLVPAGHTIELRGGTADARVVPRRTGWWQDWGRSREMCSSRRL